MHNIKIIAFDADDTLWINEPLFRINEEKFEDLLKKYISNNEITNRLYKTELKNLKHFGYGIKGFIISMIETAIELTDGKIEANDIKKIIDLGKEQILHPVNLLDNIPEVLETLKQKYKLMIITKGDLFDQESKIARSGLADYFDIVEIVSEKNEEVYSSLLKKHNIKVDEFLMVGNSLKSDVLPLINIGAKAIHIPFHTTWIHEEVKPKDLESSEHITIEKAIDILQIL